MVSMKELISILVIMIVATTVLGSNIAALVNDEPITTYELQNRKKMILVLNNVQNPDANTMSQINKLALNSLIEEQILLQHTDKVGGKISSEEIDEAIKNIEERNKMQKGDFLKLLKSNAIDPNSLRAQVKGELIKMNILSYISKSVSVTPREIDTIILSTNSKDAKISARLFTSKDKSDSSLHKMYGLQKRIKNCDNIKPSMYDKFADIVIIDENLSSLEYQLQSIIRDLNIGKTSSVFETKNGFKFVLLCNKKIDSVTSEENSYVVNLLTNKKMSQKAMKFFEDLRKKAYIKVLIPQ